MNKSLWAFLTGIIFILAGINHLISPSLYIKIMPPYLANAELLILLSGIAEVICGVLLLIFKTRKVGAWLSIILLIMVFPANIQMTVNEYDNRGLLFYISVLRLPLQGLLIWMLVKIARHQ